MTPIRYGSVCSGIEAASLAWEPLGMEPAWFAEIEPFPSAVLAHRWPHVTNYGDMTLLKGLIAFDELEAPDVLVGGTPCQAFSVAGARAGLDDPRGRLTISYVELADEIDKKRRELGKPECIAVWENVPGVLSSKDNAFGSFLGLLAGEDCALVPPGKRWTNAGCVFGPERAIAWRVIDAQYFGVAQRRRRVFLIASAREGFDPCQVLFELDGLRRDSTPSREAGAVVAGTIASCTGKNGGIPAGKDSVPSNLIVAFGQNNTRGPVQISHCLNAHSGPHGRLDFESETFLVQTVHGTQDPDTAVEMAHTLGCNQGQENAVPTQFGTEIAGTLTARHDSSPCADRGMNVIGYVDCGNGGISPSDPMGTLVAGSPSGGGRPLPVVAFSSKDYGGDATEDMSPTLRACGHTNSHANAGAPPAVVYPILEVGKRTGTSTADPRAGLGVGADGDPMFTLQAGAQHGVAAFAENSRQEVRLEGGDGQITGALSSGGGRPLPAVAFQSSQSGVRLHDTHANAGAQPAVAYSVSLRGRDGGATAELGDEVSCCLRASSGGGDKPHVLAPAIALQTDVTPKASEELSFTLKLPSSSGGGQPAAAMTPELAVRRLTPVECERLQGFPDNHTLIPAGKLNRLSADEYAYMRTHSSDISEEEANRLAADGPRYKAIGNSKAVPCVRWLGARLLAQLDDEL